MIKIKKCIIQTEKDRNLPIKEENLERNNLVDAFGNGPAGQEFGEDAYVVCYN